MKAIVLCEIRQYCADSRSSIINVRVKASVKTEMWTCKIDHRTLHYNQLRWFYMSGLTKFAI